MTITRWDSRHAHILISLCLQFADQGIRYFILRNYEGLPDKNTSKDVDIVIDPIFFDQAKQILKNTYKENNITFYYEVRFSLVHCCHGINVGEKIGIHIDLIRSYVSQGSELFTFNELYAFTENYKEFRVLNKYFEGVMVFIYKQFNYQPVLKPEYKQIIYTTHRNFPEFKRLISELVGEPLTTQIFTAIEKQDFDQMLTYSPQLTKALRRYAFKKNPMQTLSYSLAFYVEKANRIVFNYRHFSKVFSVMAPDGGGKTTFLEALIEKINFFYVNDASDGRCHVYQFRPNLLPNLGVIGEKMGIKEQDTDFTNPHRSQPAGRLSSLVRISYYWLDYVLGFNYFVRKDVQYDRFSVFDRYSYDLIVDPLRTRLNLPVWVRRIFVKCMSHPSVVFYLSADPDIIFQRKQELPLDEIKRQTMAYEEVVNSHPRFIKLDSNRPVEQSVDNALVVILDTFAEKL